MGITTCPFVGEPGKPTNWPFAVGDPFWGGTMTNCVPGGTMTAPGGGPRPPYMDGCTTTPIGTPFGPSAICWPGGSRMGGAMGSGAGLGAGAAFCLRAAGFFLGLALCAASCAFRAV